MSKLAPAGGGGGSVPVEFHLHNEGGQVEKKSVRAERKPDGRMVIRAHVKQAMGEMASNGELDQVMAPYGRRSGQV